MRLARRMSVPVLLVACVGCTFSKFDLDSPQQLALLETLARTSLSTGTLVTLQARDASHDDAQKIVSGCDYALSLIDGQTSLPPEIADQIPVAYVFLVEDAISLYLAYSETAEDAILTVSQKRLLKAAIGGVKLGAERYLVSGGVAYTRGLLMRLKRAKRKGK